jgi:AcrR family transcriptional regulator
MDAHHVQGDSERRAELLEVAYAYVLRTGIAEITLRPLARAVGSSPRVLLFLFGSKEGLLQALLARARVDELEPMRDLEADGTTDLAGVTEAVTLTLATLRGALLDLLATDDTERVNAGVSRHVTELRRTPEPVSLTSDRALPPRRSPG